MTEPLDAANIQPPKEDPETFVLRGRPRPVVRFRRGPIAAIAGAVGVMLVTVSWVALQPKSFRKAATAAETAEPDRKGGADALANVPNNYGDVPRLGPPLPGDLGRPILEHQRSVSGLPEQSIDSVQTHDDSMRIAAQAQRDRLASTVQAARNSPVVVQLGATRQGAASAEQGAPAVPSSDTAATAAAPSGQQHKIDFARAPAEAEVNVQPLRPASSQWTLAAGTIIPASLVTGLNSDLPGMVVAQVTENVRDSATGQVLLIPQGARLIGRYDSAVSYGQRRALLVWNRIVFPDGSSVGLDNMSATDRSGYAGVVDKVNSHAWALLKGIAFSTLLGVGTQLGVGRGEGELIRAVRESAQQNAAHAGDQMTSHNLDVQPTIEVRPGWPVRVLVSRDLVLRPWSE